jgi:GGDEF domain-containing protein
MLIIDFLSNAMINSYQKRNLVAAGIIILVICICEALTAILNGAPVKYRFWHIAANFIAFSLVPGVIFCFGKSVLPKPIKYYNCFYFLWIAYIIFMLVCLLLESEHGIICVNKNNVYHRGKEFFLFIILYGSGTIFFFFENLYVSMRFWKKTDIILIIDFFFLIFGTSIPIIMPHIQVTWTCIIIGIALYYLYYESLFQQLDTQTLLLNYNSLKRWKKGQKKQAVIVTAELDNYAKLKLNYSREQMNTLLTTISRLFNSYYMNYGRCFRIGSDEFAAVIPDTSLDFERLNRNFFISLVKYNFETADLPLVSLGHALMDKEMNLEQALTLADEKKRFFIKERLNYLYKGKNE